MDAVDAPDLAIGIEERPLSIKGLQERLAARNGAVPIQGAGLHALNTFLNDHRSIADLPARAVQVAKLTIAEDVGDDLVHVGDQFRETRHGQRVVRALQRAGAQVRGSIALPQPRTCRRATLSLGVVRQAFGVDDLHVVRRRKGADEQVRTPSGTSWALPSSTVRLPVMLAAIALPGPAAELERLATVTHSCAACRVFR
ncbi:hypothetical protein P4050_00500 [Pseudomonas aeruginosa]|nr:hypothetical protein [Pseudomonas aeruginosa]